MKIKTFCSSVGQHRKKRFIRIHSVSNRRWRRGVLARGRTLRSRSSKRRRAEQLLPEAALLLVRAGVRSRQRLRGCVSGCVRGCRGGEGEGGVNHKSDPGCCTSNTTAQIKVWLWVTCASPLRNQLGICARDISGRFRITSQALQDQKRYD